MMSKQPAIPLYGLDDEAAQGLYIRKFTGISAGSPRMLSPHRDDHYIFILHEKGDSRMMLDFRELKIKGSCLLCILPAQVHHIISVKNTTAWFMAMDTSLVSESCRQVLARPLAALPPLKLRRSEMERMEPCIRLLEAEHRQTGGGALQQQVLRSLAYAATGLFALGFAKMLADEPAMSNRPSLITRQFRDLLQHHHKTLKSPAAYAAALNISPSWLNEAVRRSTGMPVSYWIQQHTLLEARRMLCYTDVTVKEIAHALGYEDHTYFSRFFHKSAGITPLAFRKKYRE